MGSESTQKNSPVLFDLEKEMGLDKCRPFYQWASSNAHSNHISALTQLGMSEAQEEILLAGPSNSGLTDPSHSTALSLNITTVSLLSLYPSVDWIVMVKIIIKFADEIGEVFLEADNNSQ
tara:strand:+ start:302 stop:661 length:360 start_codon:yes stop_codon:yes gene_type:complete